MSAERVESLIGKANAIVDTIPAPIFGAVTRFYARHGYRLRSYVLVSGNRYEATFETHKGSR